MWGSDQPESTYYDLIAKDPDVVKVVLLLTGSIEGMKMSTTEYLSACPPLLGARWLCRACAWGRECTHSVMLPALPVMQQLYACLA